MAPFRLAPSPVRPVVDCPAGRTIGATENGLRVFRGLPYARPPTGERRFRPAEPLDRWGAPRDAARFGPASAQVYDPLEADWTDLDGRPRPPRAWAGDEDSLTLNLWTPAAPGPHPVIVYIHGGANWLESARLPAYDGAAFARADCVFVSFNYRLGVFGFLDLTPIGGPRGAHRHGLTDQAAALAWVSANIAAFGGDPGNMTVVGESAGSMDIGWLLAAGLLPAGVRRLMLMSGAASVVGLGWDGTASAHGEAEGARRAATFLAELGYATFEALAAAPTREILTRHAALATSERVLFEEDTRFYPRTGALAFRDPFAAARAGAAAGLDVIVGFTAYEMGLWLAWDDHLDRRPPEWAAQTMPHLPAPARAALPDLYRAWFPHEAEGALGMHLLGDAMFAMPSLWMADCLVAGGARVFAYRFDHAPEQRRRAAHALDQAALFGTGLAVPCALHRTMLDAVTAFARTGDPSTPALAWPRYTAPERATMLFDTVSRIAVDPLSGRRAWWTANVLPTDLGGGA